MSDAKTLQDFEDNAKAPDTAAPATPQLECKAPNKISRGEKLYNWAVYSGINYWVNLIGSIAIADYFTNLSGRKHLDRIVGGLAKGVRATKLLSMEKAYHHSKTSLETLALNTGGWILLIPMKWMEDRKRPIVHWLNKKLGEPQLGLDGHTLAADEIYIEKEQPPQGWGRVLWRRFMASMSTVVAGGILDHAAADKKIPTSHTYALNPFKSGSEKVTLHGHLGGKERTTDWVVGLANKGLGHVPGGEKIVGSPRAQRWLALAALDTFFTKMTASVMWMTRGAEKKKMPHEVGENGAAAPPAQEIKTEEKPTPAATEKFKVSADGRKKITDAPRLSHAERALAEPQQELQPSL